MSNQSAVYGFMAVLEGDLLRISDGIGGGEGVAHRDDAIREIESYVRMSARFIAEAIVDDLGLEDDGDDTE
jgi:hypothetical protein